MPAVEIPNVQIEPSWKEVLKEEFSKDYFQSIKNSLQNQKQEGKIMYPSGQLIFNAYNLTSFDKVKVVLLGQDPYHGTGQAHGVCFSVPKGVRQPPSLVNIFKELRNDTGVQIPDHGNLEKWTKQGVFLLNAILTVQANKPSSHKDLGWQHFTDETIRQLSAKRDHLVFMLWGKFAQEKASLIDSSKHLILKAAHPSPYSADNGFFGCRHFSKANEYLKSHQIAPIDWRL
ncbi:MAG: uracil-DNA glycosylase [Chitinophagales bacterium]|nr:uracil-DNA glycosylase [Chitinophagales bacterium]